MKDNFVFDHILGEGQPGIFLCFPILQCCVLLVFFMGKELSYLSHFYAFIVMFSLLCPLLAETICHVSYFPAVAQPLSTAPIKAQLCGGTIRVNLTNKTIKQILQIYP